MVSAIPWSPPAWRERLPSSRMVADAVLFMAFAILLVLPSLSRLFVVPLVVAAVATGWSLRGARLGVVAILLGLTTGAIALLTSVVTVHEALIVAALGVGFGVLPWLLAVAWRARREIKRSEAALLEQQERARWREAEAAQVAERSLLAEELHDDLGHVLSLVALNLGRLELEPDPRGVEREAIAAARRQVADAVSRLGDSVEALRGDTPPLLVSRHQQLEIDELIANARASGAVIDVVGQPTAERLSDFGIGTVFRTVQEGITNAVKHAPGKPVTLRFIDSGDRLRVIIRNTNTQGGQPTGGQPGYGLVALRERVRIAGGTVTIENSTDAFVLTVTLPGVGLRPEGGDEARFSAVDSSAQKNDLARARRRSTVGLWAAVLTPVVVLICLAVALTVVDMLEARSAELDASVYEQIDPGDSRQDVEPLLPAEQLDVNDDESSTSRDCSFYAITSNPLDDRSGDYYRICFDDDVVTSTSLIEAGGS